MGRHGASRRPPLAMAEPADDPIRARIVELDALVPPDEAQVQFMYVDDGAVDILANRAGFLRLGIELMKRPYEPLEDREPPFDYARTNYLEHAVADIAINDLHLVDALDPEPPYEEPDPPFGDKAAVFLVGGGCLLVVFLLFVGIGTVIGWIF